MSSERTPAYARERQVEDIFLRPLSPTSYSLRRAESVSWTVLKIARETRPTRDNIQIAIWGILLLANERRIEAEILMNGLSLRDPQVIGTLAAASLCLGGVAVYFAMRKKPTAEEMERERRAFLVQTGRIIDGTLLDISELDPDESGRPTGMQLILYKYEIGGVVYECSQDVTTLRDLVNIYDCRLGFPCSVRYDTHKPENSIIFAETWSGLRDTANSVPVRRVVPNTPRSRPAPLG
jgi:hypothetical protein